MAGSRKSNKKSSRGSAFYRLAYAVLAKILGFIFNIRVIGRENEPDEGGFMVCANHVSATDPICLAYAFKKHQIRFMAKKELFRVPIVGQLVRMLGAFPVDRGAGDVGAIKKSVKMLTEGECMGIFPQGHRYPSVDPRTTPTKNGAALIATRANANILPVYIARKDNKHKLFRRTWVIIGTPVTLGEIVGESEQSKDYTLVTNEIFDRICKIGESLSAEKAKEDIKKSKR